jgi:putative ABC transport system substrate-binding protein
MRRRECIAFLAGGAGLCLLSPWRPATAQPAGKVFKLGWLRPNTAGPADFQALGIPAALKRSGWVEGQNLQIERRRADGHASRLPALARELVQQRCDALFTVGLSATRAAADATASTSIVFFGNFDPVATGLVDSLARPGGNVSGVLVAPDGTLAAKKMEPLREAVPRAVRVGFLSPEDPAMQGQIAEARRAAAALGQEAVVVTVRSGDHAAALSTLVAEHAQTLLVGAHTSFMTERRPIIERALRHKLPTMWEWAEQVRDGGLMAYSTSLNGLYDRVAGYIDRVFRGAGAGDLPIEQPPTFGLVLNQGAAHAIGLSLPRPLLLRAEEVIE